MRIKYVKVDIKGSASAREALQDISQKVFGATASADTPTTLAGRQVIRGANMEAIRKALADESRAGK